MAVADKSTVKKSHGGGWNRKSVATHIKQGTYRPSQHGARPGSIIDYREKPKPKGLTARESKKMAKGNASLLSAVAGGARYSQALVDHVVDYFAEYLCHSKGEWAGQPFELFDWQIKEIIAPIFGWLRPDGTRLVRRTYIELPKKNGKSSLAAGIGLYMLIVDEEPGAEVYSLGADKDQAKVVHNEAVNMIDASPKLTAALKVNRASGVVQYAHTKSLYSALSGQGRGKHGINVHCGIIDELHEWYGSQLWDSLKYSYRARREPLQFVITNAGNDMESICWQQREKAEAWKEGTIIDPSFYGLVKCVPREVAEKELQSIKRGSKKMPKARDCNDGLGTIIKEEDLLLDINDAIHTPRAIPNLLRLTYGVWVAGQNPWFDDPESWDNCQLDFTEGDLLGQPCWLGLDLSRTRDMTSVVMAFPQDDELYILPYFWIPQERAKSKEHLASYFEWAKNGHLNIVPGNVQDYSVVRQFIVEQTKRFKVQRILYDPYNAELLCNQQLSHEDGLPVLSFSQGVANMAPACSDFERAVLGQKLRHNGHPLLKWQAGHVQVKTDPKGNIQPVKPKAGDHKTIDGIVAAVMATAGALHDDPPKPSVYKERGMLTL